MNEKLIAEMLNKLRKNYRILTSREKYICNQLSSKYVCGGDLTAAEFNQLSMMIIN